MCIEHQTIDCNSLIQQAAADEEAADKEMREAADKLKRATDAKSKKEAEEEAEAAKRRRNGRRWVPVRMKR